MREGWGVIEEVREMLFIYFFILAPTIAPTFPPTQPPTPPPNRQLPCIVWGESHFLSFAKNIFTFRGYGEYILARFGLDLNLTLEVQIRLAPSKANSTSAHAVCILFYFLLFIFLYFIYFCCLSSLAFPIIDPH